MDHKAGKKVREENQTSQNKATNNNEQNTPQTQVSK
jgi:hypothetical protein